MGHLEAYTSVKCMYLEGNGFAEIQGLTECKMLVSLYLQENCISIIEGLQGLPLRNLNLAQNFITQLENLAGLPLTTLNLKRNKLKTAQDLKELLGCPTLGVLDISDNLIDDVKLLDLLSQMPNLKVLYLKGNDVTKKIKSYRKTVITSIPTLTYLDDRPVFPEERLRAEAWSRGGMPAERAERKRQQEEKREKARRNHEAFHKMMDDAAAKRKRKKKNATTGSSEPTLVIQSLDDAKTAREQYLKKQYAAMSTE